MKVYGRASISDLLGDRIVYRSLNPMDPNLPNYDTVSRTLKTFSGSGFPRKKTADYARIIAHLVQVARFNDLPGTEIRRVIYVGDTRMNDGSAFFNICEVAGWEGMAFIGADRPKPLEIKIEREGEGEIYDASRWSAIQDFEDYLQSKNFRIDEQTAALFDMDKTLLGARGRNDHAIDQQRVTAAQLTVQEQLADQYSPTEFQNAYDTLNQPEFHPFTADNQDYLVYVCLILSSGLLSLSDLIRAIHAGEVANFKRFIVEIDQRAAELPDHLRSLHNEIYSEFRRGNPTPFKAFRMNEFLCTAQHLGHLSDDASVDQMLAEEITMTHEVYTFGKFCKENGALLFGLSDKPDEASLPTPEQETQGYLPIHRIKTHIIGE